MALFAARSVAGSHRFGVTASHARLYAEVLAPTAAGVLEHPRVVEGALGGIEVLVLPDRAELVRTPARGFAGGGVHAAAAFAATHVDDLLMGLAVLDPDLRALFEAFERAVRGPPELVGTGRRAAGTGAQWVMDIAVGDEAGFHAAIDGAQLDLDTGGAAKPSGAFGIGNQAAGGDADRRINLV